LAHGLFGISLESIPERCDAASDSLFLKEDQLKKLQILSDKTGAPVAELIRRGIDRYLKERAKELK
jgi:Ribbon-helix-helix domain